MIIKRVEVKNFRAIREASIDCDDLTILIGRNGAGKSSFLYAIDAFYDISARISDEDYFDRDTTSPIEIRLTYEKLREDEKAEFSPYIRDEKLIVTKRISLEEGKIIQRYYAAAFQIPQFADIRAITAKKDRISTWNELISSNVLSGLNKKAKSADEVEGFMKEYEAEHSELMQPIEREVQFFGPKNIGGGKLDKFTKFVLVPAVREALDEVSGKKGAIYQILDMIVLRKINSREDIQRFRTEFENRIKELYSSENLSELPDLGNSISRTLEKFAPGSKLKLGWDDVKLPEIPIPAAKATLIEDKFEGEITHKGHGLQRALIVTLLQHLALISPEEQTEQPSEIASDSSSSASSISSRGPNLILALEEPELYLHPSRCRYLSNLLLQLSEPSSTGIGESNQIIYTSHSPYFVDLNRFDKIKMVRKGASPDSSTLQTVISSYSLSLAAQELARVCNEAPSKFTRDTFKVRAMSVMNTIVSEGFFADVVVVVEGTTEVSILWKLQEILKKEWSKLGIVVVPAGGKNNLDRPVVVFKGLEIPTYFIFDADAQLIGKADGEQEAKKRNHRYLRLANAQIEDFPNSHVYNNWAVFKENLEGEFKEALGKDIFCAFQKQVASELGYDDLERACKNIEGASRLIEIIYERDHRIPVLEDIIERITRLRG
jgi:predicted ATP-dependent endonuclease of OLD family